MSGLGQPGLGSALVWASAVLLFVAALVTMIRLVRGPTVLNRTLASDVLVSIMICALGLEATVTKHDSTVPILISVSLVGFVASVSVSRFVARDTDVAVPGVEDEETSEGKR